MFNFDIIENAWELIGIFMIGVLILFSPILILGIISWITLVSLLFIRMLNCKKEYNQTDAKNKEKEEIQMQCEICKKILPLIREKGKWACVQ